MKTAVSLLQNEKSTCRGPMSLTLRIFSPKSLPSSEFIMSSKLVYLTLAITKLQGGYTYKGRKQNIDFLKLKLVLKTTPILACF